MRERGKRTGARPIVINGVTFYCYRTGILRTEWQTEDGRLAVGRRSGRSTYYATYYAITENPVGGGTFLTPRFRSLETAMRAAVKAGGIR